MTVNFMEFFRKIFQFRIKGYNTIQTLNTVKVHMKRMTDTIKK